MTETLPHVDQLLSLLVDLADRTDLELSITLTTASSVVTGVLISGGRWAELNVALMEGAGENLAGMKYFFDEVLKAQDIRKAKAATVRDALTGVDIGDDYRTAITDVDAPSYIHLRDARMLGPSGLVPTGAAAPWRGRLSEIAGWSIGEMRTS
ncbi:hypothetical protein [Streptomyces sp. CB03911]|uniref:hypothetical protein n=1 Tax=Streptomyces sp. CB03911 TaxID=1804758 RepID=UPI00093FF03F|nr:hypothetical protein [Streptomyces sp. CB03911]OKI14227.1 hypothetical protein A6A07_13840 [Streptomyces sp. CB03911]